MNSNVDVWKALQHKDFTSTFCVGLLWIKLCQCWASRLVQKQIKHKRTAARWQTSFREQFQVISAEVRWIKHVLFTNGCVCADAPVRTFSLSFHVREFLNSAEWISLFFVSRQHEIWPHQLTAMIENFLNTNQFSPGNQLIHSNPADGNRICLVFIETFFSLKFVSDSFPSGTDKLLLCETSALQLINIYGRVSDAAFKVPSTQHLTAASLYSSRPSPRSPVLKQSIMKEQLSAITLSDPNGISSGMLKARHFSSPADMLGHVPASSAVWRGYIPPSPAPIVHLGFLLLWTGRKIKFSLCCLQRWRWFDEMK